VLGFRRGKGAFEAACGLISAINPGEVHTGCAESPGGWEARNILIGRDQLRALVPEAFGGAGQEPVFEAPVITDMTVARRLLQAHWLSGQAGSEFEKESALVGALGALFLQHAPPGTGRASPGAEHPGLRRAVEFVRDNHAAGLSLGEAAEVSGLSKFHFLRAFTSAMDITPHAYLVQIRVHEATRLLRAGHSISAAAAMTGFADQSHFTRCFKRTMGVPPRLFLQAA
jgi:AraC-like DNA-binding protein